MSKYIFVAAALILIALLASTAINADRMLGRAVSEAKTNPFFGLEGVRIDAFSKRVEELATSINLVADLYSDPQEKVLIKEALHPLAFLRTLSETERSRRAFIREPSPENLRIYRKNLIKTALAYERDLTRYRSALADLKQKKNGGDVYNFLNVTTSFDTLIKSADDLLQRAKDTERDIVVGHISASAQRFRWRNGTNPALPEADREAMRFMKDFMKERNWSILSPAIETPTQCFGQPDRPDLFFIAKPEGDSPRLFSYEPVYYKLPQSSVNSPNYIYYKPWYDAGFEYFWQTGTNYYMCPDLVYHAESLTVYGILELLKNWQTSADIAGRFPELESAINGFLNADPLWRSTQLRLFDEVRNALFSYPASPNREILEKIALLEFQKTGGFEELVERGVSMNRAMARFTPLLSRLVPMNILFMSRSYASLYFLPFNKSIWPSGEPPEFIDGTEKSPHFFYYDELKIVYSKDQLFQIMEMNRNVASKRK
ncbi:MAG: hypothetical protein HY456_00995 [Parcubacteria group bacterium]|nr:hypothetical protein [Parcubacteria group bacterium]